MDDTKMHIKFLLKT